MTILCICGILVFFVLIGHHQQKLRIAADRELTVTASAMNGNELLGAIEAIYRHLGPDVPECVAATDACYEWRSALAIAKLQMARHGSTAFYSGDKVGEAQTAVEEAAKEI